MGWNRVQGIAMVGLIFVGVALGTAAQATSNNHWDIVVNVPARTPPGASIYLTGDLPQLCQWQPRCWPMNKINEGTYRLTLHNLPATGGFNFKVTRGDWNREAADPGAQALGDIHVDLNATPRLSVLNVSTWTDTPPLGVTGHLERHENFYSPQLGNSRTLSVWLPPDYETNTTRRYPVIYMHDGQNVFDPRTSTFGVDWSLDEAMTDLIAENAVPPAIVVGVDCTPDREEEYDFTKLGRQYGDFLIHTVKPFIDAHYRTAAGRATTYTMGASMGALISLSIVWTHPEYFAGAGAVSVPAFASDEMIIRLMSVHPAPTSPVRIYMDHGDSGDDAEYGPSAYDLYSTILKKGFPASSLRYRIFPYASHSETDWSRRVRIPLRFLLTGQ
jgi:predicted alpha/beta superfamily hydrolase